MKLKNKNWNCKHISHCGAGNCEECDGEALTAAKYIIESRSKPINDKSKGVNFEKNITETIEIDEEAYKILMRCVRKRSRTGKDMTFSGAIKHMENVISSQRVALDEIREVLRGNLKNKTLN